MLYCAVCTVDVHSSCSDICDDVSKSQSECWSGCCWVTNNVWQRHHDHQPVFTVCSKTLLLTVKINWENYECCLSAVAVCWVTTSHIGFSLLHWCIQAWADQSAVPSLTQSWGLIIMSWLREAVCLGHGGEYSYIISIFNIWRPFCMKMDKKLSSMPANSLYPSGSSVPKPWL